MDDDGTTGGSGPVRVSDVEERGRWNPTAAAIDRDRRRVVVRLRSLAPDATDERQRSVLDRLDRLVERGVVGDLDVGVWGRRVPEDATTRPERRLYDEWERWAGTEDSRLTPAFRRCEVGSMLTDECRRVIEFPVLCFAVYERGSIVAVYPHTGERGTVSVHDGLERLERMDPLDDRVAVEDARPVSPGSSSRSRSNRFADER